MDAAAVIVTSGCGEIVTSRPSEAAAPCGRRSARSQRTERNRVETNVRDNAKKKNRKKTVVNGFSARDNWQLVISETGLAILVEEERSRKEIRALIGWLLNRSSMLSGGGIR